MVSICFTYFIGIFIGQIIYNTGAFEVFCDDKLIWSTIEKNGIKPSLKTIIQLVKNVKRLEMKEKINALNVLMIIMS